MLIRKDASPDDAIAVGGELLAAAGGLITRAFEIKAFDESRRTADFVASTGVIDAHDEIVDQGSWVLDDYLKNPVVLFAHNSRDLPIGKSIDVQLVNGPRGTQLENRVEFATEDMNPLAEKVWKMVVGKFLRAVSVGFVPRSYRYEMRDGVEVWVWADCVLKEISVTPVPANPEALAKAKSLLVQARNATIPLRGEKRAQREAQANPPATPGPNPGNPETKETKMTTELKELQDKLDKQALAIAELRLEAKTLGAANDAAQARADKAEAQVKSLETELSAHHAQAKALAEDRDAQRARAEKAEDSLIEIEVESVVGKKITPAEKPAFLELRKSNAGLFAKMIEQRSDIALDKPVIKGADVVTPPEALGQPGADDAVAEAERLGSA